MSAWRLRRVLLVAFLALELLLPARATTVQGSCACPQTEPIMGGGNLQQVWQRPSQANGRHS